MSVARSDDDPDILLLVGKVTMGFVSVVSEDEVVGGAVVGTIMIGVAGVEGLSDSLGHV